MIFFSSGEMEHKQSNYITAKLGPHLVAHAEHGGGGGGELRDA